MTRSVPAQTFSEVPDGILDLLILHLPYSLSLVRRLQYTAASPTGKTPSARIVVASDSPPAEPTGHDAGFDVTARHFTVSYFDPSRGPETQTWIYSTLEDAHARDSSVVLAQDETAHCEKQIMAVVSEVKRIAREYDAVEPLAFPRQVIVGTLHHAVRAVMRKHDVSLTHRHDYQKIIFPFDKLPSADAALPAGLSFETTTLEDCHIVKSRTDIPRKVTTLFTLPSITIKQADGTPVAWAFLGMFTLEAKNLQPPEHPANRRQQALTAPCAVSTAKSNTDARVWLAPWPPRSCARGHACSVASRGLRPRWRQRT
ncbi:hypothetical protein VDGD_04713 [Verticillium dahliae]|nr:hypothetical protein VDGD_04713 [Verticillium dahliae]